MGRHSRRRAVATLQARASPRPHTAGCARAVHDGRRRPRRGGRMMADHILAIDQGTTSTRCMAFDAALVPVAVAQREFAQIFPAPGWVEHDPEEIWDTTVATVRDAMAKAGLAAKDIAGIGITNQRETTI